jgi:hypothetical protein
MELITKASLFVLAGATATALIYTQQRKHPLSALRDTEA